MTESQFHDLSGWLEDDRVSLDLSCTATSYEHTVMMTLTDVSFGGACLRLQAGGVDFDLATLKHIDVEDLGGFDVIYRWRKDRDIGVSFRNEERARPVIKAFLDRRGIEISARPYG